MNPEEAILAYKDLGEPYALAIHHQTFRLTDEAYDDPVKALAIAQEKYNVSSKSFRTLNIGEAWDITN